MVGLPIYRRRFHWYMCVGTSLRSVVSSVVTSYRYSVSYSNIQNVLRLECAPHNTLLQLYNPELPHPTLPLLYPSTHALHIEFEKLLHTVDFMQILPSTIPLPYITQCSLCVPLSLGSTRAPSNLYILVIPLEVGCYDKLETIAGVLCGKHKFRYNGMLPIRPRPATYEKLESTSKSTSISNSNSSPFRECYNRGRIKIDRRTGACTFRSRSCFTFNSFHVQVGEPTESRRADGLLWRCHTMRKNCKIFQADIWP